MSKVVVGGLAAVAGLAVGAIAGATMFGEEIKGVMPDQVDPAVDSLANVGNTVAGEATSLAEMAKAKIGGSSDDSTPAATEPATLENN